jgi:membrane-bound metal-dependent hydrolase YbcI (DUF457 family)
MLAGLSVAWTADAVGRRVPARIAIACAALGALPDGDLIVASTHRTATHSVTGVLVIFIVAAAVTGQVTRWRTAAVCAAAYASHLLLDWLGVDRYPPPGIQLLWPWSDAWYISGWNVFRQTLRQQLWTAPVMRQNAAAIAQEIAILLPLLAVLWWARGKDRNSEFGIRN